MLVMTADGEVIEDVNASKMLHLDKKAKPIEGFWEPGMVCSFVPGAEGNTQEGTTLFIAIFHRFECKQYHFNYSLKEKKKIGEITEIEMKECTFLNFPIKSFYSPFYNNIFVFYRQGQCITIDPAQPKTCNVEKITEADFGSMFLLFDKALIVRSSSSIMFFKIDAETNQWVNYHTLPKMRGDIFFIKGNIRFQITTDEKIYFYRINKETLMPEKENVMYNFMNCSQMMFGSLVRYCITFKTNQPNFSIWVRKAWHNFKV